ncbi:MAG: hypothetical protein ACHQII_04370 [Bacteroidia bacterium]
MQKILVVTIFIVCFFKTITGNAQTDSVTAPKPVEKKHILCKIKMQDGSVYTGFIDKQTDSLLYVKSGSGVLIHVPKKQVVSIDFIDGHTTKDSTGNITIHIPAIAHSYYVATSNSFLLKKGEVYGSSADFLFYNINYAVNQNFSLGISTSPIASPIMLHVKANFEISHKLYFGLDGVFGSGSLISPRSYGGGGLLKLTYGDFKTNFTISGGYGDVDYFVQVRRGRRGGPPTGTSHYENFNTTIISAAFAHALSPKIYFVLEGFAVPNINIANVTNPNSATQIGFYSLSPGIRTNFSPHLSWILGINGFFYTSTNKYGTMGSGLALPYAGFSFAF